MRLMRMKKRCGGLFPGEVAGWEDPKFSELLRSGYGDEVDSQGNVLLASYDAVALVENESDKAEKPEGDEFEFNEATDPFIIDGLSKDASLALHAAGMHNARAVMDFLAGGGMIATVEGVSGAQAKKIVSLYKQ